MMMDKRNGPPAWLLILAFALALGGCVETDTSSGGGGEDTADDSSDDGGDTTLGLTSFSVEGTYETTDGTVPITPSVNEGLFTMHWSVEGFDPEDPYYDARVYLSEDDVVDDGDITLFWASCSDPNYVCTTTGTQTCSFSSSNRIYCDVPQNDGDGMLFIADSEENIDAFFTALPKSAYLVMRACTWWYGECTSEAVAVEFE